ncbi:Uncharacterised protein [Bordetella pertussis]|nr:Uncharacterised protein [Bordetella pertussis]
MPFSWPTTSDTPARSTFPLRTTSRSDWPLALTSAR